MSDLSHGGALRRQTSGQSHKETTCHEQYAADSVGAASIEKTIWRLDPDRSSVEFNADPPTENTS